MSMPVLLPLQCPKCQTPFISEMNEVAWLCSTCGQAAQLDETQAAGISLLDIHFAGGITPGQKGRPFWVAQGIVSVSRETYSGNENRKADEFWQKPRSFFVPAFSCSLDDLIDLGMQLIKEPVSMMQGQVVSFLPVILSKDDVRPMVEFIIMGLEAERRDMVKSVQIQLNLAPPGLWILP